MNGIRGHIRKNHQRCQEIIKLLSLISLKNSFKNAIMLGIFPTFNNTFSANIYIGNAGEKGGLYFPWRGRGAPFSNEPVSQYKCLHLPKTDDNDRTHKNDANTLS